MNLRTVEKEFQTAFAIQLSQLAELFPDAQEVVDQAEIISSSDRLDVESLPEWSTKHVINLEPLNNARFFNKFLESINSKLDDGGCFIGCAETADQRCRRIFRKFPAWFARVFYVIDFVYKRILPKLWITKQAYFAVTNGRNRVLSRAEILGRLVACGFEIVEEVEFQNKLYFLTCKTGPPAFDSNPSYGPIFRMRRVGKGGKPTHVYKIRTMHPYAEYLQEFVYNANALDDNGKIKDDFRITAWGKVMRKCWVDELPMLVNLVRGDMKLVGVRPISEHYLSLYPKHIAEKRLRYKPGLVPPFYADLPESFEEIVASEDRYLQAYEKHPFRTDMRYLLTAAYNILVKRARSQ